jgi:hypothetical protein
MKVTLIFPSILIILDVGAALGYAAASDWRRAIYWVAAGVLTAAITF